MLVDPIHFELIRNSLGSIADEMALTIVRTSHSGVLKDNMDFSTAVCDAGGRVAGIFTDGDLRRLIETGADLRAMRASDVMSASPKLVRDDALAVEAAELMERHRVTGLLVVDHAGMLVGAINSNDLMRAKVI